MSADRRNPRDRRPPGPRRGRPPKPKLELQTTTLWEFPSQHYGKGTQGAQAYKGATPSYVIWNLLTRYTREGDVVIDPMCGSGTTLDVCRDLERKGRGFDLGQYRDDIEQADARDLPLDDETVDFVFLDPPYSTNLKYTGDPRCIGELDAHDEAYFDALDEVLGEMFRVMKDRRYIGLYICDVWDKKKGFVPIGMRTMALMLQYFRLIEHVCVVRHNKSLKRPNWHKAAVEGNYYLRGFNHLLIAKKELPPDVEDA